VEDQPVWRVDPPSLSVRGKSGPGSALSDNECVDKKLNDTMVVADPCGSTLDDFPCGLLVRLGGLCQRMELNGLQGLVVQHVLATGRAAVRLPGFDKAVAVLPHHLCRALPREGRDKDHGMDDGSPEIDLEAAHVVLSDTEMQHGVVETSAEHTREDRVWSADPFMSLPPAEAVVGQDNVQNVIREPTAHDEPVWEGSEVSQLEGYDAPFPVCIGNLVLVEPLQVTEPQDEEVSSPLVVEISSPETEIVVVDGTSTMIAEGDDMMLCEQFGSAAVLKGDLEALVNEVEEISNFAN